MRDEILYRLKASVLLVLFMAPVAVLQWSSAVQAQLERQPNTIDPAPEFALLQFVEEDDSDVN